MYPEQIQYNILYINWWNNSKQSKVLLIHKSNFSGKTCILLKSKVCGQNNKDHMSIKLLLNGGTNI